MLAWLVLCGLVGVPGFQQPGDALRRELTEQNPAQRREAAKAIAAMGREAENWLLREVDKGSAGRRRALLLASALMGTERSLALVEKAARPGRRPDPERAWALLLFGAYHEEAAADPKRTLRRPASDFERCCLLAGLLARCRGVQVDAWRKALGRREGEPAIRALLRMIERLAAADPDPGEPPADALEAVAVLLGSTVPGAAALPADWLESPAMRGLPEIWRVGARREPARGLEDLRRVPAGGPGDGLAMVLLELAPDLRPAAFDLLRARLVEPEARTWLWGTAGDLGLALPEPEQELSDQEAAAIVRLAAHDLEKAGREAQRRRGAARARLEAGDRGGRVWPAALVLALAGGEEDRELLRERLRSAGPVERERLQPILQLALGNLDTEDARRRWLRTWSRELGAGYLGWLDRQGPLWVARLLVGGTEAATQRPELAREYPDLWGPRDHSRDDTLYADLVDYLLSSLYHWDLP